MSELDKVEILFSAPFLRRLKGLAERYRHIQTDLQRFLAALALGNFQGDRPVGLDNRQHDGFVFSYPPIPHSARR